jgi:hypothetical protein
MNRETRRESYPLVGGLFELREAVFGKKRKSARHRMSGASSILNLELVRMPSPIIPISVMPVVIIVCIVPFIMLVVAVLIAPGIVMV